MRRKGSRRKEKGPQRRKELKLVGRERSDSSMGGLHLREAGIRGRASQRLRRKLKRASSRARRQRSRKLSRQYLS